MDDATARSLIGATPAPMVLIGPGERVVIANAAATALLGPAIEGRTASAVLRHPDFLAGIDAALERGAAAQTRLALAAPGGGELQLLAHFAPISAHPDGPFALVMFEDQTPLERAVAMRRDFVANVSHELRTPLTALVGFIETLKGAARDDPEARLRFLNIMEREAGRMIRLVSDLLSLSRVEADERRRPTEPVALAALLRSVLATLKPQADAVRVDMTLDNGIGDQAIPGDVDQLTQVFHNLVENAIKYGADGGIVTVRLSRLAREPMLRGPAVQVEVIDRGDGIEDIHIPRLTERFYRVDTHRSREQGGTGLGLAIVKHIVHRHRGLMRVASQSGQGSIFTICLPEG
jgi:two-component system phosphate regulon sensor histidine kinase PhoR